VWYTILAAHCHQVRGANCGQVFGGSGALGVLVGILIGLWLLGSKKK
jgi:hypothetical protein